MKIAKWIYYILLVVVNLAGSYAAFYLTFIYFFSVAIHDAFARVGKGAYMTQGEKIGVMMEMSCYGLIVFLFVTLVSYLISLMFRKRLAFDKGRVGKHSLIQVLSLAVGCVVAVCIALMITGR